MSYDDGYEDRYDETYDDGYDAGSSVAPRAADGPGYVVGDAETLLRRAIDIIATEPTKPLS